MLCAAITRDSVARWAPAHAGGVLHRGDTLLETDFDGSTMVDPTARLLLRNAPGSDHRSDAVIIQAVTQRHQIPYRGSEEEEWHRSRGWLQWAHVIELLATNIAGPARRYPSANRWHGEWRVWWALLRGC